MCKKCDSSAVRLGTNKLDSVFWHCLVCSGALCVFALCYVFWCIVSCEMDHNECRVMGMCSLLTPNPRTTACRMAPSMSAHASWTTTLRFLLKTQASG